MDATLFRIFVVDDDPLTRMIVANQFDQSHYQITGFDSGEACLAAMEQSPDLILLDIEMPGIDGIAVCRTIREAGNAHVQVLFISVHDDLETRLAAYDAGGDDFIVKTFDPKELERKVLVAEHYVALQRGMSSQIQFAQQTAFTAMSSMSEMGVVLQFVRASFGCRTLEQLANAFMEALQQFGLQGLLLVRHRVGALCFSSQGECSPLEVSILEYAEHKGRITQFGARLAINYPRATLMVLDLPLQDDERVGRLRDHLAVLVEAADARLDAQEHENQRVLQAEAIMAATAEITRSLSEIEQSQDTNRNQAFKLADNYLEGLESAFLHLGLTEKQEETLVEMAKTATDRLSQLLDINASLGERLGQTIATLRKMAEGA